MSDFVSREAELERKDQELDRLRLDLAAEQESHAKLEAEIKRLMGHLDFYQQSALKLEDTLAATCEAIRIMRGALEWLADPMNWFSGGWWNGKKATPNWNIPRQTLAAADNVLEVK